MSLQLHRPDGKGGLEVRTEPDQDWRTELMSSRWGGAFKGGRLPSLANSEMNPTSTGRAVALWLVLGLVTFVVIAAGYGAGLWHFVAPGT
jgi:hypothetical protein